MISIFNGKVKGLYFNFKLMKLQRFSVPKPNLDNLCRSLGMCKKCGNLRVIACSGCQGVGFTKDGGPFSFIPTDDFSFGDGNGNAPVRSKPCTNCNTKGRINCPECHGKPQI